MADSRPNSVTLQQLGSIFDKEGVQPEEIADHDTFYVRRWASDGLEESERLDSLFKYVPTDAEPEDIEKAGCACRTAGSSSSAGGALVFGLALLAFVRRRRVT